MYSDVELLIEAHLNFFEISEMGKIIQSISSGVFKDEILNHRKLKRWFLNKKGIIPYRKKYYTKYNIIN